MTELGFRYRPLTAADQEAHAAQVMLLARDLSHVHPGELKLAADAWAQTNKYMPKACDLLEGIRRLKGAKADQQLLCDQGNVLVTKVCRSDIHWVIRDGHATLEWKHRPQNSI